MNTPQQTVTRKSVPLSAQDVADMEALRKAPRRWLALSQLVCVEIGSQPSEASVLHAVLEAGLRAVCQLIEEEGYADMAAQQADATARRVSARRPKPSWSDE